MRRADTADVGKMDDARVFAPLFRLKKNAVGGSVSSANLDFLFYHYCLREIVRRDCPRMLYNTLSRTLSKKRFKGAHHARVNFREAKPGCMAHSQSARGSQLAQSGNAG